MMQFFADLPLNPLLLTGLVAGLLTSVSCGIVAPYVVSRRIVFLAGAISHMAIAGIGASIFLRAYWPREAAWFTPEVGALLCAPLSAMLVGYIHHRFADRLDTLIGALWAVGMAVGLMLSRFTPGYQSQELMDYLFGRISVVSWNDIWMLAGMNVLVLGAAALLHKRLLAVCLDEEQAHLQGVSVLWTNILLLTLVGVVVICLMQVVGAILVLALLTLPAATAAHHAKRLAPMMLLTMLLCAVLSTAPRVAAYGSPVPPEHAIVLSAAGVYMLSACVKSALQRHRRTA